MRTLIIATIILLIVGGLEFESSRMGYNQGQKDGYKSGHDAGVKEGLQAYANHMSDILSGDYKFCQLNGDPLVVATESGHLTFMCKKGDVYYGYKQ